MRFSLSLPTDRMDAREEFGTAEAVAEMAAGAERAGFDAVFVTEHPIPAVEWLAGGGHHALDPFVALSFAAAATSTLRLHTNLCVVPYRNPFLLAKSVASLDSLSGGRVIFGAGAGYLEGEFAALGVDYSRRNEIFDESLDVLKRVWRGETVAMQGAGFRAPGNRAQPLPVQQPHPPIWIGGNSKRAIRRAVEHADGWMPMFGPPRLAEAVHSAAVTGLDDLRERLDYAREHADAQGRSAPLDVLFMPTNAGSFGDDGYDVAALHDEIGRQRELGVSWLSIALLPFGGRGAKRVETRARFLELCEHFGAEVIAKL